MLGSVACPYTFIQCFPHVRGSAVPRPRIPREPDDRGPGRRCASRTYDIAFSTHRFRIRGSINFYELVSSSSVLIGSRVFIWERNSLACTASHSRAFALRLGNANRIRRAIEHPVLPTCTALRRLRVDPDADVVHLKDAGRLRPLFASPRPHFASPIHALARPQPARRYHVRVPEFEWPRPLRPAAWQSP